MKSFSSIPFKAEKHGGLSEVNGVAKFSGAGIVLEFESKLFGLISDGVKEARIPLSELMDVKFKKGVFKRGAKIEIRTKSLGPIADLPKEDGKLILKLKAEDFDRANEAVTQMTRDIATYEAAIPPIHTPVSVLFDSSEDEMQELRSE